MAADDVREWEIVVWRDGKIVDGGHCSTYEGTYAGAVERAQDVADSFMEAGYTGELEARIAPSGVLFESVPNKWRIDEERGELYRLVPSTDPYPHVAVRAMEGGGIHVVCERGLNASKPALAAIHQVVLKHQREAASIEVVVTIQRECEVELAKLAGRRTVVATPLYENHFRSSRTWA